MSERILFVLKQGSAYGSSDSCLAGEQHSGLYWSSKFTVDMLVAAGVDAKFVEVFDNSFIDAEIVKFKPTIVVVEALWVVPSKFVELKKLHPDIEFVVLLHSDTPFISDEIIAVKWIKAYAKAGVTMAVNSKKMLSDIRTMLSSEGEFLKVQYLPDFYPVSPLDIQGRDRQKIVVGCFGAIRPLKNQLIQAVAAIKFANKIGRTLEFHINGLEVDEDGKPILQNIRDLFSGTMHTLVEDKWVTHEQFLESLKSIDIGMQVSLTETFCIVAADMVSSSVPTVVSPEVVWVPCISQVNPTDGAAIAEKLHEVWMLRRRIIEENHFGLMKFVLNSKAIWLRFAAASE
jgi:glycosyltransferase involved in cell wall biosynthesis